LDQISAAAAASLTAALWLTIATMATLRHARWVKMQNIAKKLMTY